MIVLGISSLYHDSAAAIIRDGVIIAAAQEERFSRKKHDAGIPVNAIQYVISEAKIKKEDIDWVAYYDNPLLTLDRFLSNAVMIAPDAEGLIERSFTSVFSRKIWIHKLLEETMQVSLKDKFCVVQHHISHAASAFYPSPFQEAVILTIDGVGEWDTTTIGIGKGKDIKLYKSIEYPHSLGLLYSAFTYFCGFRVNSGDYKFMGLAPYGKPKYYELIKENIIDIKEDGSYRLNLDYFDYQNGRTMVSDKMTELFGGPRRLPESDITRREMDIAASVQKVLEEIVLRMVRYAKSTIGEGIDNLVMAGGVALNCVANGKIQEQKIFRNIWIQPAAGDAGGALGAAMYTAFQKSDIERKVFVTDSQRGSLLGPEYGNDFIEEYLTQNAYPFHVYKNGDLYEVLAKELADNKIIGLIQGRMEFGPRALGARSIIANPCSSEMQSKINLKIKYRESFRPFAPAVLEEDCQDFFKLDCPSPYMLLVSDVKEERRLPFDLEKLMDDDNNMLPVVNRPRSDIPAVTHVDYSARIQTVNKNTNPYLYRVLQEFKKITGTGMVVNTSFNVRGEPIVCTPEDGYRCFMRTDMDVLVLGNVVLYKEEQPEFQEGTDWREQYELD